MTPRLLVDSSAMRTRVEDLRRTIASDRLKLLLCVKALPVPEALRVLAPAFDGSEISNLAEALIAHPGPTVLNSPDPQAVHALTDRANLVVSVGSPRALATVRDRARYLLRLNAVLWLGPDVLLDPQLRLSRFGLGPADINPAMHRHPNFLGVHVHFGRTIDHDQPLHARLFDRIAVHFGSEMAVLDLGGGQHRFASPGQVVHDALARFPLSEIWLEPGRWLSQGCVTGVGRVLDVIDRGAFDDVVLDLSHELHCRWRDTLEVVDPPAGERACKLSGPTCAERDVLGWFDLDPDALRIGREVTLAGLNGYCLAFNQGFNGIPAAAVAAPAAVRAS
jgi:diaminopimelate decarboxylase